MANRCLLGGGEGARICALILARIECGCGFVPARVNSTEIAYSSRLPEGRRCGKVGSKARTECSLLYWVALHERHRFKDSPSAFG